MFDYDINLIQDETFYCRWCYWKILFSYIYTSWCGRKYSVISGKYWSDFLLRLKNSFTTFRLNCTTFGLLNLFIIYWPISAIEAKTLITSCILLEFSKSVYRIMFFSKHQMVEAPWLIHGKSSGQSGSSLHLGGGAWKPLSFLFFYLNFV